LVFKSSGCKWIRAPWWAWVLVGGNTIKLDIRLEQIKLSKEIPEIEFKLNSADSCLLIHSVAVASTKNLKMDGLILYHRLN
jgi:hypothetical protein